MRVVLVGGRPGEQPRCLAGGQGHRLAPLPRHEQRIRPVAGHARRTDHDGRRGLPAHRLHRPPVQRRDGADRAWSGHAGRVPHSPGCPPTRPGRSPPARSSCSAPRRTSTSSAGARRRRAPARLALFLAGIACIATAIISPLDRLAEQLLSMHMVQHLLLLDLAPILIILGFTKKILRPATTQADAAREDRPASSPTPRSPSSSTPARCGSGTSPPSTTPRSSTAASTSSST